MMAIFPILLTCFTIGLCLAGTIPDTDEIVEAVPDSDTWTEDWNTTFSEWYSPEEIAEMYDLEEEIYLENITVDCYYEKGWRYSVIGDSCVKLFEQRKNFTEALEHCWSRNARLVEVKAQVQEILMDAFFLSGDIHKFWLGSFVTWEGKVALTRMTSYQNWTLPDYYRFQEEEPDPGCVGLVYYNTSVSGHKIFWKSFDCSTNKYFMCQKRPMFVGSSEEFIGEMTDLRTLAKEQMDDTLRRRRERRRKAPSGSEESSDTGGSEIDLVDGESGDKSKGKRTKENKGKVEKAKGSKNMGLSKKAKKVNGKGNAERGNTKKRRKGTDRKRRSLRRKKRNTTYDTYSDLELCLLMIELARIGSLTIDPTISCV